MIREKELKCFRKIKDDGGYIYICLASDKTVKIGITKYPYTRIRAIETSSGKEIIDWYISEPCKNYRDIEVELHNKFKTERLKGEWFNCNYNNAISILQQINKIKIENDSKIEEIKNNPKVLSLIKLALEIKYEEFEETWFDYNLNKWIPNEMDIDFVINEINENIIYNNKSGANECNQSLYEYLNIINRDKYSTESKKAMQEYYLDFIDAIGYYDIAKKIMKETNSYEFIKKVLGIQETKRNLFVEELMRKQFN